MGTTQSLSKQSQIQLPKQWKQVNKAYDSILYQHTITKNQCKAIRVTKIPSKDYKIYQDRLEYSYEFNPAILAYQGQPVQQIRQISKQNTLYNAHVIVEQTKYKLSHYSVSQLFQRHNGIVKLQQVVLGTQFLYEKYGSFKVQDTHIGWMANFKTKVWMNSNYALNNKEASKSNITQMLQAIFQLFNEFIPKKYQNIRFRSFVDALDFIKKILQPKPILNKNQILRATYGSPSNQSQINLINKTVFSPNQSIKINFVNGSNQQSSQIINQKREKQTQNYRHKLNQRIGPLYSTMPKKPDNLFSLTSIKPFNMNKQSFSIDSNRFGSAISSAKQNHDKIKKQQSIHSQNKNLGEKITSCQFLNQEISQRLTKSHRYQPKENSQIVNCNISIKSLAKSQKKKKEGSNIFAELTRQIKQSNSFYSVSKYNLNNKTTEFQCPEFPQHILDKTSFKTMEKTACKPQNKPFVPLNVKAFENPSSEIKDMLREKIRVKTQQTMCDSQPFEKITTPKKDFKQNSEQKQNFHQRKEIINLLEEAQDALQDELDALFVEDRIEQQNQPDELNQEIINEFISIFDD